MTKNLSLFDTSLDKVVDCLNERYNCFLAPKIYTNFGSILVAVNPIYLTSDEYSGIYGQSALTNADAHIYAVAKRAIDMVRPGSQETLVVIGDSGSGKTVTVGHVLDYLTASSRSPKCDMFYQKIVSASHLMELFANAQTCLNTNSSRFGKLISLVYNCGVTPQLEGAEVEAFLLEKSRVTSTPEPDGCGENFHILRLLVSKLNDPAIFAKIFGFQMQKLSSGEFSFRVAPFCRDLSEKWYSFDRTCHLLSTFGFDEEAQFDIFKTLSVILHLCNLEFVSRDDSLGCEIANNMPNVQTSILSLLSLLGISDFRELQQAITSKPVSAMSSRRQSVYRKPCGVAESEGRRNSVARLLYSQLFEFVMSRVCSSVAPVTRDATSTSKISVLDIFGFENFTKSHNDFEQLCINFCNEKIQQHFARICISDVRRELAIEGLSRDDAIESSYSDNEAIVSLFESSPSGIFCILEEKCRLNRTGAASPYSPRLPSVGSGAKLTKASTFSGSSSPSSLQSSEEFYQTMCLNFRGGSNKSIRLSRNTCQFTIFHYAGPVVYSCENWVEKSRDDVSPDLVAFFSGSIKNAFISSLMNSKPKTEGVSNAVNKLPLTPQFSNESAVTVRKRSLPAKYRLATASLITFLNNSTNVHYVRCIRPNGKPATADRSVSDRSFDRAYVSTQLVNAGLADILRLANATGKLSRRFSYRAFSNGFSPIFYTFGIKHSSISNDANSNKENLASSHSKMIPIVPSDDQLEREVRILFKILALPGEGDEFFFGKTKLFLSDKLLAFFRHLHQIVSRCAVYRLQKGFRKFQNEKKRRILAEKERQEIENRQKIQFLAEPPQPVEVVFVEPEPEPAKKVEKKDVPDAPPPAYRNSLYLPSIASKFFVDGGVISRRRHFLAGENSGHFWFHIRPNLLLHGAHVVNANLFLQPASLTDCLD